MSDKDFGEIVGMMRAVQKRAQELDIDVAMVVDDGQRAATLTAVRAGPRMISDVLAATLMAVQCFNADVPAVGAPQSSTLN